MGENLLAVWFDLFPIDQTHTTLTSIDIPSSALSPGYLHFLDFVVVVVVVVVYFGLIFAFAFLFCFIFNFSLFFLL